MKIDTSCNLRFGICEFRKYDEKIIFQARGKMCDLYENLKIIFETKANSNQPTRCF